MRLEGEPNLNQVLCMVMAASSFYLKSPQNVLKQEGFQRMGILIVDWVLQFRFFWACWSFHLGSDSRQFCWAGVLTDCPAWGGGWWWARRGPELGSAPLTSVFVRLDFGSIGPKSPGRLRQTCPGPLFFCCPRSPHSLACGPGEII